MSYKVIVSVLVLISLFLFTSSVNTNSSNVKINERKGLDLTEFVLKQKLMKPDYNTNSTSYYYIMQNNKLILKSNIYEIEYYNHDLKDTLNIEKIDNLKVSYFDLRELPKGIVLEKRLAYDKDNNIVCVLVINNDGKKLDCICPDFVYFCVNEKQIFE